MNTKKAADLILHSGHITTLDPKYPDCQKRRDQRRPHRRRGRRRELRTRAKHHDD